ncbi:MAG TPA: VOC family protein [Thermoanaerobaculia bacterium]
MTQVSSHEPGSFCWVELSTSDAKSAREFYKSLFGWTVNEMPMGDQGIYYMFQKKGKDAAAMYEQMAQEKSEGIPPHWNNYVAVTSADASAQKAKSLGGKVLAGPFDVFDAGRMAFVQDPQGAMLAVWQAKRHIGVGIRDEPGTLTWNELLTSDIEGARKFYSALFGWNLKTSPEYTEIHVGERAYGGMMQIRPDMRGMPSNWAPYFAVDDTDAIAKKAQSSGGSVFMQPTDIPNVGRFAVIGDPQRAMFSVIKVQM